MPALDWDPQDFMECLGAVPEIGDDDPSYHYAVTQAGITLELLLWPHESVLFLSLRPENQKKELISFTVVVRGPVRYRKEKWGEYLIFPCCVLVPERWYNFQWDEVFDQRKYPQGVDMELYVYPAIRVTYQEQRLV